MDNQSERVKSIIIRIDDFMSSQPVCDYRNFEDIVNLCYSALDTGDPYVIQKLGDFEAISHRFKSAQRKEPLIEELLRCLRGARQALSLVSRE